MLGVPVPTQATSAQMVSVALQLTTLIRREGRRNLGALSEVRDALSVDGLKRALSRVFDAIMWFAHPAAGFWRGGGTYRCASATDYLTRGG